MNLEQWGGVVYLSIGVLVALYLYGYDWSEKKFRCAYLSETFKILDLFLVVFFITVVCFYPVGFLVVWIESYFANRKYGPFEDDTFGR